MIKVIHLADDGTEMAAIEVDDFTIEVIYSGIAEMLREAAATNGPTAGAVRSATGRAPAPRQDPESDPRLSLRVARSIGSVEPSAASAHPWGPRVTASDRRAVTTPGKW